MSYQCIFIVIGIVLFIISLVYCCIWVVVFLKKPKKYWYLTPPWLFIFAFPCLMSVSLGIYHISLHTYIYFGYKQIYSSFAKQTTSQQQAEHAQNKNDQLTLDDKISVGIIGDSIAVLALMFLIYSVIQNTKALKMQREELKLTREEMEKQRLEMDEANKKRQEQLDLQQKLHDDEMEKNKTYHQEQLKQLKREHESQVLFHLLTECRTDQQRVATSQFRGVRKKLEELLDKTKHEEYNKKVANDCRTDKAWIDAYRDALYFWKKVSLASQAEYVTEDSLFTALENMDILEILIPIHKEVCKLLDPPHKPDKSLDLLYEKYKRRNKANMT